MRLEPTTRGYSRNVPVTSYNVRTANVVLGALSGDVVALLEPSLRDVSYQKGATLWDGEDSDRIFFPMSGLISVICPTGDGSGIEVGCVGRESAAGFSRSASGATRGIVRIGGNFLTMPAHRFWAAAAENRDIQELASSCKEWLQAQAQRLAACNAVHEADRRLARWLLQVADRAGKEIASTQEEIAHLLGVRRTTLTLVANKLQQGGSIAYKRGVIVIRDRAKLEAIACDCYHHLGQPA